MKIMNCQEECWGKCMNKSKLAEAISILNTIKSFAKYLLIPTGAITFMPDIWLNKMKLFDLKNLLGSYIAGVFLLSLSIVFIDLLLKIVTGLSLKAKAKNIMKNHEESLNLLSHNEKNIIFEIYKNDNASLPLNNASVFKLERLGMIARPNVGERWLNFSYTLQPWLLEYLNKNPDYFREFQR